MQRTVRRVNDEATQRIINEEAERRLVAAYINGLGGIVGQQLRFRMLSSLEEAVQVAITISIAKRTKQPDTKRVFSAKRDGGSPAFECYNCGKRGHYTRDCRSRGKGDLPEDSGRARQMAGGRRLAATDHVSRNSSTPGVPKVKVICCFHCHKAGHRRDRCLQLTGNKLGNSNPNNSGSIARSQKSTQSPQASR